MRLVHSVRALTLSSVLFASSAFSADPPPGATTDATPAQRLAASCAKVPCRKIERNLDLRLDANRSFRFQTQMLPYVDSDGTVILYPGDTVTISVAQSGGKLAAPKIVRFSDIAGPVDLGKLANSSAPAKSTVTFAFSQEADKKDMKLVVTNHTALTLKYSAMMGVPTADGIRPVDTSSCPLLPATSAQPFMGHEGWPHAISMLVLTDLRVIPQNGPMTCN